MQPAIILEVCIIYTIIRMACTYISWMFVIALKSTYKNAMTSLGIMVDGWVNNVATY